jgi:hypothetical protein
MPDTSTRISTKSSLGKNDWVESRFDDGACITIMNNGECFRVTQLDLWGRPIREARNFPGVAHAQEREARDYAAQLYRSYHTGGHVVWTICLKGIEHTIVRNAEHPEHTRQLLLI